MNLTPHFTLEELTLSQTASRMGLNNVPAPDSEEFKNLKRLAETMEDVRIVLGNQPIIISSGYRSPQVNVAVGGAQNSAHLFGLACDFTCPSYGTPLQICKRLEPLMKVMGIDQLIYEFSSWVHLGLAPSGAPRMMALTINNNGTQSGIVA